MSTHVVRIMVSFKKFLNVPPPRLAQAAKRSRIHYDGGGMAIGGGTYDHFYFTRKAAVARKFAAAARRAGFKASSMKVD